MESLVLPILKNVLGKYVDGLAEENLKLAVWSGDIEFDNIQLKPSALDELRLPISVTRGFVGKILLKIPWASLTTNPVRIEVESLYLQASPLDVASISVEELKLRALLDKQSRLQAIEESITLPILKPPQPESTDKSYVQSLTEKIIENAIVSIKKIHIRYEDSLSSPGDVKSFGLVMGAFEIFTPERQPPVDDASSSNPSVTRKIARMRGLGIYCDRSKTRFDAFETPLWKSHMESIVSESNDSVRWVLKPCNEVLVNAESRDIMSASNGKYSFSLRTKNINFVVFRDQFLQILETAGHFGILKRQLLLGMYRPRKRPTECPKLWWKYAFMLISGRKSFFHEKVEEARLCLQMRRRYIQLTVDRQLNDDNPDSDLYRNLKTQINEIEENLPMSALAVFRREAAQQIADNHTRKIALEKYNKRNDEIFWNNVWAKFGLTHEIVEGIVSIALPVDEEVAVYLEESRPSQEADDRLPGEEASILLFDINSKLEAKVLLILDSCPFSEVSLCLSSQVLIREKTTHLVASLDLLEIQDLCSVNPSRSHVLALSKNKGAVNQERKFVVANLNLNESGMSIECTLEPSEISLNEECVQHLLKFIAPPTTEVIEISGHFDMSLHSMASKYMEQSSDSTLFFIDIRFLLCAPQIILPKSGTRVFLLLDIGTLSLSGSNRSGEFKLDADLVGVHAAMFDDIPGKMYREVRYEILNNFNVHLAITTDQGCVGLSIKFDEELIVTFHPQTFFYLFEFLNQISKTFASTSSGESVQLKNVDDFDYASDDVFEYINPSIVSLRLICDIHSVKLQLKDSSANDVSSSVIIFSIDRLLTTVTCRPYDVSVNVIIGSVNGEDLSRSLGDTMFMSPLSDENDFLVINLTTFTNILSKDYTGNSLELTIQFSSIMFKIDTFLLHRLEPFMTNMYLSMLSSVPEPIHNSSPSSIIVSDPALCLKKGLMPSLKLIVSVEKVLFDIRHTVVSPANIDTYEKCSILVMEPMFHVPLSGISFQLELRRGLNMAVSVQAFEVFDNRIMSEDSKYRRILGSPQELLDVEDSKVLSVRFVAMDDAVDKYCDVVVGILIVNASLDTIFDLLDVVLMFVQTLLVTVVPKAPEPPNQPKCDVIGDQSVTQYESWVTSSIMHVSVKVSHIQAILIQNMLIENSSALLVNLEDVNTKVTICTQLSSTGDEADDLILNVDILGIGLLTTVDVSDKKVCQVLDPFPIKFEMSISPDKATRVETKSFKLHISNMINVVCNLSNLQLILSIVAKRIDDRRRTIKKNSEEEANPVTISIQKRKKILTITKIECTNLHNVELLGGKNDPFVSIHYRKWSATTTVQNDAGDSAIWEKVKYTFDIDTKKLEECLTLKVFDHNTFRPNEIIGEARIKMSDIVNEAVRVSLAEQSRSAIENYEDTIIGDSSEIEGDENVKLVMAFDIYNKTKFSGKITLHFNYCILTDVPQASMPTDVIITDVKGLSVTILNDISGRNNPLLAMSIQDFVTSTVTYFLEEKNIPAIEYSSRVTLFMEYYRYDLARWEPILEHVTIAAQVCFENADLELHIKTEKLLQLNVSDVCLKLFLDVFNTWNTTSAVSAKHKNELHDFSNNQMEIIFESYIGIPLVLHDAKSRKEIIKIDNDQIARVPLSLECFDYSEVSSIRFKLTLEGPFGSLFNSINDLSLISIKTDYRELMYKNESIRKPEPVVEILYENQRFDLIRGWVKPFIFGDPTQWSNVHGENFESKEAFMVPVSGWRYLDDGNVDLQGAGVNIDDAGWEYSALPFSAFSLDSPRRRQKPLDVIRRRKWLITRVPENAFTDFDQQFYVSWSMSIDKLGYRVVQLRSSMNVHNYLQSELFCQLVCKPTGQVYNEIGPIPEGEIWSIPLYYQKSTHIRFRSSSTVYSKLYNYTKNKNINVSQKKGDDSSSSSLNFQLCLETLDKGHSMVFVCKPHVKISNCLPFDITYRTVIQNFVKDSSESSFSITEEGVVVSGGSVQIKSVSSSSKTYVVFGIQDQCDWSELIEVKDPTRIESVSKPVDRLLRLNQIRPGGPSVVVSTRIYDNELGYKEIRVFTKYAVINKTGLQLFSRSYQQGAISDNVITSLFRYESKSSISILEIPITLLKAPSSSYVFERLSLESPVYSDSSTRWCYFPHTLEKCKTLLGVNSDASRSEKDMILFSVSEKAIIYVLYDSQDGSALKYLDDRAFCLTSKQAFAYNPQGVGTTKCIYKIAAKIVEADTVVTFDGFDSLSNNPVILVGPFSLSGHVGDVVSEILHSSDEASITDAHRGWTEGQCGIIVVHTDNEKLAFGLVDQDLWSKDISLSSGIGVEKRPFDIKYSSMVLTTELKSQKSARSSIMKSVGPEEHEEHATCCELVYTLKTLPGLFRDTTLVKLIPRYSMVNCCERLIFVKQVRGSKVSTLLPYTTEPWYSEQSCKHLCVEFRLEGCQWTMGNVDINEIGTSEILTIDEQKNTRVLHIEVRLAGGDEDCYIAVIIWESSIENCSLSVRNDFNEYVIVRQLIKRETLKDFDIVIAPNTTMSFGWLYPSLEDKHVQIAIRDNNSSDTVTIGSATFTKISDRFVFSSRNVLINAIIEPSSGGMVLHLLPGSFEDIEDDDQLVNHSSILRPNFLLCVTLCQIGVSVIVDRPKRREIFNILLTGLSCLIENGEDNKFEILLNDIQVDNFFECSVYPVLIHHVRKNSSIDDSGSSKAVDSGTKEQFNNFPCIRITAIMKKNTRLVFFHLIEISILELSLEVDSGTIFLFFSDFIPLLKDIVLEDEYLATLKPEEWSCKFNSSLMNPCKRMAIVDAYSAKEKILSSKLYIRDLTIHPLEVHASYDQTSLNRSRREESKLCEDFPFLPATKLIVAFDDVPITLNSFNATDILDSVESLGTRISSKYISDIIHELVPLAGNLITNLDMFGRPAGLVKNIGTGLKNFFYQPIHGAMQSPYGLITGIQQGTSALVSGVVSSTLGSASTIVDNATKTMVQGAIYLTGDNEFRKQQQSRRIRSKRTQTGVVQGFKHGGEYLVTGIKDGVTGLISRPIEGVKSGGVVGFFRGLGEGIVGGIVKPVVGLSSGVASIASGISQQVSVDKKIYHYRPPRVFYRTNVDDTDFSFSLLNIEAAFAQDYVSKRNDNGKNIYLDFSVYDDTKGSAVILSQIKLYFVHIEESKGTNKFSVKSDKNLFWHDIKYFEVSRINEISIVLFNVSAEKQKGDSVHVMHCKDEEHTVRTYKILHAHTNLVGNPSQIISPKEVIRRFYNDSTLRKISSDENEENDTKGCWEVSCYKFGSSNMASTGQQFIYHSESDILKAADSRFCGNSSTTDLASLDLKVLWLIHDWCRLHNGYNASISNCCATLVLNSTKTSIQIRSITMYHGRDYNCFGEVGFDKTSNSILPGGFVVIFAYGYTPSLIQKGNIKISISSTAFNGIIATKKDSNSTFCESLLGYSTGFLEKTHNEKWCKNVLLVTNTDS